MSNTGEKEFQAQMRKIESLIAKVEQFVDPAAREQTREIISALLDLHGRGIDRVLEHVAATDAGVTLIESMAKDEMISSLLLLHGLHPVDFATRIGEALAKVRPYLHSHGGDVELLSVENNVVRLRMQGSCHGCPSSAATLKGAIEEAIYDKAPDVTAIEVEGVTREAHSKAAHSNHKDIPISGFVPVEMLFTKHSVKAAV